MKRLGSFLLALSVAATGCARVDETIRTERGPLLRTYERPFVVTGGVRATAAAQWPALTLQLEGYDTCRTETVEEYAEDKIRERGTGGLGAAISAGVFLTAVSLGFFAAQSAFSDDPNRSTIDGGGRYGPSTRTLVRNWTYVGFAVGVPTLVVGIIGLARSGTDTTTTKVEQVASQRDNECHQRSIDGPLALVSAKGTLFTEPTNNGALAVQAKDLKGQAIERLVFFEREVSLDPASAETVRAFSSCVQLEAQPAAALEVLPVGTLLQRIERSRECRPVRTAEMNAVLPKLEAELERRREGGEVGAYAPGSKAMRSFEDAIAAWPPRLQLSGTSPDLNKLDDPEAIAGTSVLIHGKVLEGVTLNIGVVQVGDRQVFVFLPNDPPWGGDFSNGTPVDLVGVVAGMQTVGQRTAPLIRAMWLRRTP